MPDGQLPVAVWRSTAFALQLLRLELRLQRIARDRDGHFEEERTQAGRALTIGSEFSTPIREEPGC